MPQFTFTPVGDEPGQAAPGPRQITPIDESNMVTGREQFAPGGAPMFAFNGEYKENQSVESLKKLVEGCN